MSRVIWFWNLASNSRRTIIYTKWKSSPQSKPYHSHNWPYNSTVPYTSIHGPIGGYLRLALRIHSVINKIIISVLGRKIRQMYMILLCREHINKIERGNGIDWSHTLREKKEGEKKNISKPTTFIWISSALKTVQLQLRIFQQMRSI